MDNKKYTWNLIDLYKNRQEWEKDLEEIKTLTDQISALEEKMTSSAANLITALKLNDDLSIKLARAYSYARINFDTNMGNDEIKSMYEQIDSLATATSDSLAFFQPRLLEMSWEEFEQYKKEEPELNTYSHSMEKLFKRKEHILTRDIEEILARMNSLGSTFKKVFDDITVNDLEFPEIKDKKGNPIIANEANYHRCLNSYNRDFRQRYFKALLSTYGSHQNSITSAYYGSVKHDVFLSRTRKYSSSREMSMAVNFIPVGVYDNLIETVRKNIKVLHKYIDLRKKALKLNDLHFYDLFVPLVENADVNYTFEEAKNTVTEALSILGGDYIEVLYKAFNERWIDVYPKKGKRSGAYAIGIYGAHPYSLLNYSGTLDDVFTLAHELGHVMHSYYSNENQPYINSHYTIFTAEVASTVNETLLYYYLMKSSSSNQQKAYLLNMHLDSIRSTFYRQVLFADFEMQVHDLVENEKPVTPQVLRDIYKNLYSIYHGDNFVIDEELTMEWLRIPHFYRSFYVYQYATGIAAAISIAKKIIANQKIEANKTVLEGYKDFLKSGGSDYSLNLLKKAGVDMTSPQPITDVIKDFEETMTELEKIL